MRRRETSVWVVLTLLAVMALLAWISTHDWSKQARGGEHCYPHQAHSTKLWYVPAGHNTAVTLIAYCDGTAPTVWAISFFEGEQPGLWDWYDIQNTASELLRGY